jgi:hypothetical protein
MRRMGRKRQLQGRELCVFLYNALLCIIHSESHFFLFLFGLPFPIHCVALCRPTAMSTKLMMYHHQLHLFPIDIFRNNILHNNNSTNKMQYTTTHDDDDDDDDSQTSGPILA